MGGKPGGQKGRIRRFPRPELGGGAGRKAKGVRRKGQRALCIGQVEQRHIAALPIPAGAIHAASSSRV